MAKTAVTFRLRPRSCSGLLLPALIAGCVVAPPRPPPEPYMAIAVEHGRITQVEVVRRPSSAPAGAMVGGLLGLILSGEHPGQKLAGMIGGAVAGGALTAAAEGPRQGWTYTVQLLDGRSERILTEQSDLRVGDCVAVETGGFTNLRRVSQAWCEPPPRAVDEERLEAEAQESAAQCQAAKKELLGARTKEDVDIAVRKVRVLCGT